MTKQELIDYVKAFCITHDIEFRTFVGDTAFTIMNNSECSGFFEQNSKIKPTLGIAEGLPETVFYEVLAHEFSHANQYLENSPYWTNSRLNDEEVERFSNLTGIDLTGYETGDLFQQWLDYKVELSESVLEDLVDRTTGVEFDCERRTVEMAIKLGLNISPEEYAQKANAYLITYYYALKTRSWTTTGMSAYSKPEVYGVLPKVIDPVYCKNISPEIIELIKTHCVKKEVA